MYNSIALKARRGVDIPFIKEIYSQSEYKMEYSVYHCSESEGKALRNELFKQTPSQTWMEELRMGLEACDINQKYYPDLEHIDYAVKKTDRLSFIYFLYSSSTSTLYLYENLD